MGAGSDKITKRNRELVRRPIMSTQIADNLNIPNDQWITASVSGTDNFSESLTTNSTWSQTGGGPAIGANMAIYSRNSLYSGGSGGGYGGYGGSSSYSGGQNWTWSDPNLSTYDAHALSEIRITPNGPAEIGPVMFRSAPNVAAVRAGKGVILH